MSDVNVDQILNQVDGYTPPNGQVEQPPTRQIQLTRASEIQIRPVRWVWDGRIPAGHLSLAAGREGIGKSLALVWAAAQLTRGRMPGIHQGTPRPVIYAATEDSWAHTIAPRLVAARADLDLVYRVEVVQDTSIVPLTLPRDCASLEAEINRMGVAMLAIDPLMSVIDGSIDTHRDREVRSALEPLAALADRTGAAAVALAHLNKAAGNDVLDRVTASRAFTAVTRAVMAIARDPDDEEQQSCVLTQVKNNLGRLDLPSLRYVIDSATIDTDEGPAYVGRLRFIGESDRSVADIMASRGDPEEKTERDEAAQWLQDYLTDQGGEARAKDIFKAARADGIAESTLKRARSRAGVQYQRSGFGQGSVWALTDRQAPFGSHSAHSAQDPRPEPNEPNGEPNGEADVVPLFKQNEGESE